MASLTTLQRARTQLATDSAGTLATSQDPILANFIYDASDAIEQFCGYYFAPKYQLLGFSGDVGQNFPMLQLNDWPLVQADSVLNGNATPILAANYALLPVGRWPKTALRLAQDNYFYTPLATPDLTCWPLPPSYAYAEDAIQITGWWVYHRAWPTAWKLTTLTLAATIDADDTTLTLSASAGVQLDVGNEIRLANSTGTEYEVMLITGPIASSAPSGFATTTLTVTRDYDNLSGTSRAAAHTMGAAIYVWTPEITVQHAAAMAVAAFYKQRDNATGDQQIVQGGGFGSASIITPQDLPSRVKNILQPFRSHWRGRTQ